MAKKKKGKAQKAGTEAGPASSTARFPYTSRPSALRKFLTEVPKRPRPTRVNRALLASWGLSAGANMTIIRVLKAVGLISSASEPTDKYTAFMHEGTGPAVLGSLIREVYAPLFQASKEPHRDPAIRNLFNIHSGGGTIDYQIQTFKALCEHANFSAPIPGSAGSGASSGAPDGGGAGAGDSPSPVVHIDLHIHLPENKTSRDYQYIIQDIAHFLYGQKDAGRTET